MPFAGSPDPVSSSPADARVYPCPDCSSPVSTGDVTCSRCGVDLALAAVLVERRALRVVPAAPGAPFVGDAMLSRFGEFLMKRGYITQTHLDSALERQRELSANGTRETLGQVLLELGILTREQLELASVQQTQDLQNALRQVNVQLEQRVAERTKELENAYRRLAELDRLKGNFVSNISHELRTPLTKIKGFTALLAAGELGPLTADQGDAIAVMERGVADLERLVGDLIQFASGARGEMALRPTVVAVGELLDQVMLQAGEKAARRGIALACQAHTSPLAVTADAEKVRWVLNQLLDNAIKFTLPGGRVAFGADAAGATVRFWVVDTGPGIAPERLSELFEPFHQLDGSATRAQGGTGLGLTLVKMILEAHSSRISVDSQLGRGSRFQFELPSVA
ncbi:MAG: HAMP domain-containing sensor histidine kinase [Acidobacteria bacterium]|nr:HAMP domain-containing sensor histidine kinase [Acidobacteriota bacterium]